MGCIYENQMIGHEDYGQCGLCDEYGIEIPLGSRDGVCICSADLNPADSCPDYHSDYVCGYCKADLNIEYCKCE